MDEMHDVYEMDDMMMLSGGGALQEGCMLWYIHADNALF